LVQAGTIGARSYRRGPALRRILGKAPPPRSAVVLVQLIDIEADLNARRKKTDAGYNLVRHIEVMIALIAEAAILRETHQRCGYIKLSGSAALRSATKASSAARVSGSIGGCT
jgi:hypothetical protein